jgi:hypothetical protein
LLLRLIRDKAQHINTLNLPEEVKSLYCKNFVRIAEHMSDNDDGFYRYSDEKFCKDLALCRLKMIPVGAALLEEGRLSKRFLFKKGLSQTVRGLSFIVRELKGFSPCYQLHLDSRPDSICLAEFNSDGWKRTFRRIAELLKMRPTIKGVFGSTWFHDPALEAISPRLRFLNEVMVCHENRAALFYNGTSQKTIEDALSKSPTRRKLYNEGSYMPASYLVIWPRHRLIKWADSLGEA